MRVGAQVTAHTLDIELSGMNGAFARFADDSVVINFSYEDALRCADAFRRFSEMSGVSVNLEKSSGIRIFADTPSGSEMAQIPEFSFLSYSFRPGRLGVSSKAIHSIKKRCARIIYNHLLLYPKRTKSINTSRIGKGFRDWDLVTCVNELRSFIYGGRSQYSLDNYLSDKENIRNIGGAVSYFCLVEDGRVFRALDGWLADALHRAYAERNRQIYATLSKSRRGISKEKILTGAWYNFPKLSMETKLPSFFTAWRAARKSWARHGLGGVDVRRGEYAY